jgi:hypothetical protein
MADAHLITQDITHTDPGQECGLDDWAPIMEAFG